MGPFLTRYHRHIVVSWVIHKPHGFIHASIKVLHSDNALADHHLHGSTHTAEISIETGPCQLLAILHTFLYWCSYHHGDMTFTAHCSVVRRVLKSNQFNVYWQSFGEHWIKCVSTLPLLPLEEFNSKATLHWFWHFRDKMYLRHQLVIF